MTLQFPHCGINKHILLILIHVMTKVQGRFCEMVQMGAASG